MPQAIGFAILALFPQAFAATLWTAFGISIFTTAQVIGSIALTAALIGLQLAFAPRPELPKPADGTQTLRQAIAPRLGGYGRCRIAGVYMLYEVQAGFSLDVIALASGGICGFKKFYLHDDEVTYAGGVTTAVDETDGRYGGAVDIETRLGLLTETAYSDVVTRVPPLWTNDHRGDGIASLYLRCQQTPEQDFLEVYPHGLPAPSVVADMYALWDFRDEDQDPDDSDTWIDYPAYSGTTTYAAGDRVLYSGAVYISAVNGNLGATPDTSDQWISVFQNPVLQLVDYMTNAVPFRFTMGLDRTRLIDPVLARLRIEADKCDVRIEKEDGSFEPRYRSSGWFRFDNNPEDVLAAILAACDGWTIEDADGTLALRVGVYEAPTKTLQAKHVVGFEVNYGLAAEEQINEIAFSFVSPDHKYSEQPGDPWRDENAISLAGKVRTRPLPLTWVQSHSQGRRLAKRAAARINAPLRGTIVTTLYGLHVYGERWVNLEFPLVAGLEDAVVELSGGGIDFKSGRVTFEWQKINPDEIDAWDEDAEEGMPPSNPNKLQRALLPVPDNVNAVVEGDVENGIYADITFDDTLRFGLTFRIRYRLSGSPPSGWVEQDVGSFTAAGGTITVTTAVLQSNNVYDIQVASRGIFGLSEWSDIVQADTSDVAVAPGTPVSFTTQIIGSDINANWTNPNSGNMHAARVWRGAVFATATEISGPLFGAANQLVNYRDVTPGAGTHTYWVTAESASGAQSTPAGPESETIP